MNKTKEHHIGLWNLIIYEWMLHDDELGAMHMIVLAMIDSLSRPGHCTATSKYMATKLLLTPRQIDKVISELKGMGHLLIEKSDDGERRLVIPANDDDWGDGE